MINDSLQDILFSEYGCYTAQLDGKGYESIESEFYRLITEVNNSKVGKHLILSYLY